MNSRSFYGVGRDTSNLLTTGEETFPRAQTTTNITLTSGNLRLMFFTARKTESTTQVRMASGSTASTGLTLGRIGIWSVDGSGGGTLVAATANSTNLFNNLGTVYTRALEAPFTKTAGVRYAFGILLIGSSIGSAAGYGSTLASELALSPRLSGSLSSQTDLPASFTDAGLAPSGSLAYGALLP